MTQSDRGRGFVWYQLPAILWALLIFASSSIPGWVFPHVNVSQIDKVVHFTYYLVFALLVARAFRHQSHFADLSRFSLILSFLVATSYGVSDEVHQIFVPDRSPDLHDLLADMAGALVAVTILAVVQRTTRMRAEARGKRQVP